MAGRRSAGVGVLALALLAGCSTTPRVQASRVGADITVGGSAVGGSGAAQSVGTPTAGGGSTPASSSASPAPGVAQHAASGRPRVAPTTQAAAATSPATVSASLPAAAYVDVSVATLWRSPDSPRSVDQAALRQPAGVRTWLSSMSIAQRRGLNGLVDSQLVLGERVVVDKRSGTWARVVVPDQPTPLDGRGYPGWIPLAQLTFRAPASTGRDAVVVRPTAWAYATDGVTRVIEMSMGGRLRSTGGDGSWVHAELPDGRAVLLHSGEVAVVAAGGAALAATGDDVVRTGHLFDGLPYLWGGTSGFGFDCSGFTHLVYAMRGVTIPRDADAQARAGVAVARADLRPGDLVFFARNGYVHHVGIYVGNNTMLNSLQTGSPVQLSSLSSQPFASEYAGARRYLP
jgi:cell wall-associated NlpC family hydrolase